MEKNIEKRQFAGKTEFELDHSTPERLQKSKTKRHFHQRMLRAYLNGKTHFNFGYKWINGIREQVRYRVLIK